jgi:UDP-N-acetylmuramoyl-L-alanyl-D-glutamate--2,6-diaminopimelate ligase
VGKWRLADLLRPWLLSAADWADIEIQSISLDTRQLCPGGLFIACNTGVGDGRQYLVQAINKGAVALVVSQFDDAAQRQAYTFNLDARIPVIEIPLLADSAGAIVARFYGDPSKQQHVIAITGTNGKTTCSYWLAQALTYLGNPCGVIGTLGMGLLTIGENQQALLPTGHTTPDAVTLHRQLALWQQQGIAYVAIEASSHALDQGRLAGLHICQAVLTQVSRDHLDYHLTEENYWSAKRRLFVWPQLKQQIINADDRLGQQLMRASMIQMPTSLSSAVGVHIWAYHAHLDDCFYRDDGCAHLAWQSVQVAEGGYQAQLCWRLPRQPVEQYSLFLPFPGRYNLDNALAVIATLLAMNNRMENIIYAFARCQLPPGRMQLVANQCGLLIYVDFAHTPDALKVALDACREQARGQLWVVFGCGGDRDAGKRPLMGQVAAQQADQIMLTADNPRSESAATIVDEILAGCLTANSLKPPCVHQQLDRRLALAQVLRKAQAGDVVLVAGKGHECTQIIGDQVLPFNDVQVIQDLLKEMSV